MHKGLHLAGSLVLACLAALPASADSLLLEEITVRGSSQPPHEETLSMREVRETPARDLGEALQRLEGMDMIRKGVIANDVVLRGFQRDNVNVLVDSARLHGACPSRMDPPAFHYDFAEVEQVRIVKGPYDLQNPGGLGGLVEVQTKRPGEGFRSDITASYGSAANFNGAVTASYGDERLDGLLGYAYKVSDVPKSGDGRLLTDIYAPSSPNRYRPDTLNSQAYEINTAWLKLGVKPNSRSRLELDYSFQDANQVLYPYLKMDADYDRTQRLNLTFRVQDPAPGVTEVNLQAYWNTVNHLMNDRLRVSSLPTPVITRGYSMQTDASTQVAGAKAAGTFAVGSGTLKTGIDYYNRNWDALNLLAMYTMMQPYRPSNMIPDVTTDNVGAFGEYELPLGDKLRLKGGVRGDLTHTAADKGNTLVPAGTTADFSTVGGNLQLTYLPVKGLEVFLGAGRGVRPPDAQELYLDVPAMAPNVTWRGNPQLEETVNHQLDCGVKYASDGIYASGSVFYSRLQDYVNLSAASPTLKTYQNISARIWGAEGGVQFALPFELFLRGSLSYVKGENLDSDRPLAEMPPLRGSMALRHDRGVWFVELTENFASRQERVDTSLNEQPTAGWATTDLKGGVTMKTLTVIAGVNNLFDKQYANHLSYLRDPFSSGVQVPEPGRSFYLTLNYRF